MNGQFVGTFIYADDITILAPYHSSLQSMLTICDQYASRHHLIFMCGVATNDNEVRLWLTIYLI